MTTIRIRTATGWHSVVLPSTVETIYHNTEYGDECYLDKMSEWVNTWAYENEGQPCEEWE